MEIKKTSHNFEKINNTKLNEKTKIKQTEIIKAEQSDKVTLSSQQLMAKNVEKTEVTKERAEHVNRIKELVKNGQFKVNANVIADNMLKNNVVIHTLLSDN